MELRAFVLHADRDGDARAQARTVLDACGVNGELWPLVQGAALSVSDLENTVGAELFEPAYPLSLDTGEIGRFLTHRQIWAEIERRGLDVALTLDAATGIDPEPFDDALDLGLAHVGALGYIELRDEPCPGPSALIDTQGPATLTVPQQATGRSAAQLVGHEAAAHLLALSDLFDRPLETFIHSHWHTGLRPASIQPCGVIAPPTLAHAAPPSGVWPRMRYDLAQRRYLHLIAQRAQLSAAPTTGGFIN
ncbi:glycosyltransferase family 25 protein [Roseovarius sp. EGI FJ00037]|uniref:glycosyltransferase family 25 protein n=1 Tax=Roseovarius salincola TaxID=2978479 RepID=UPI0022A8704E|nr:glycosyltransferase family 25 protein [Roseovarius sp. EGI FJ00037]MCZ0812595.1 glycosyltransferase family 25 protein [Roseovarius sp. EGI FJ00037]